MALPALLESVVGGADEIAMKRTGIADSPLHGGKAPRWLFQRMTGLARQLIIGMVQEFGTHELLHRLSDPHWFQAFGSVLGFDWHSSGLTTTACGAIKEGIIIPSFLLLMATGLSCSRG